MSYTKGKWKINKYGEVIAGNNKRLVLTGVSLFCSGDEEKRKEVLANTRLIAAAPELLTICKKFLQDFDDKVYICGEDDEIGQKEHLKELKQAIATAEGK